MKTPYTVVVTLSLKNMVVGSILGKNKKSVHQGVKRTNLIIALVCGRVLVYLAVIDDSKAWKETDKLHRLVNEQYSWKSET